MIIFKTNNINPRGTRDTTIDEHTMEKNKKGRYPLGNCNLMFPTASKLIKPHKKSKIVPKSTLAIPAYADKIGADAKDTAYILKKFFCIKY
jgi:hypothetical protein